MKKKYEWCFPIQTWNVVSGCQGVLRGFKHVAMQFTIINVCKNNNKNCKITNKTLHLISSFLELVEHEGRCLKQGCVFPHRC